MTKYRANWLSVEPIECKSETKHFVTKLNGMREAKVSDYSCYFDTHEEAVAHIRAKLEAELARREIAVESARIALNGFNAKHPAK